MPIIRIKKKGLPKAQFGPPFSFTQGLGKVVNQINQNAPQEDVKAGRMSDQPFYNPFDVKWGQKQDPQIDITGQSSNKQSDPYATSTASSTSFSKGALNLPQLVNPNILSIDSKKSKKKPFDFSNFTGKLGNAAGWTNVGIGVLGAVGSYLDDRQKQKDWDKWFREQQFNRYAVGPGNDRGDFDINEGIYQPNKLTPPNVGAGMVEYGGSIGGTVTIRIKSTPSTMAYGGQAQGMALGLDLGQKDVYRHMPKEKSEYAGSYIKEVPREEANIEAEKGETAYGDFDGDGSLEHLKIGGKRHVDGGTPLDVPEGSFIFSDTAKMRIKDTAILQKFGMKPNKQGYTPAEIAKKYDVNKYKAIMEDPYVDEVRKSTAQLMIKNFQRKLAELALIQESMKGFPQGIPKVAIDTLPEVAAMQESMEEEQGFEKGPDAEQEEGLQQGDMGQPSQPEMKEGGSLPRYQGATGGSTVTSFGSINPMYNPQGSALQNTSNSQYPWFKPYTASKTKAGSISRTTGASTLFDPSVPSQYNDVDYWVKDAASKNIPINSISDLQNYMYGEIEKEDPNVINEMWTKFGPTLKSDERNIQNYADNMAGARTAFLASRRRDQTVIGYKCVNNNVISSSYQNSDELAKDGAVLSEEAAKAQCAKPEQVKTETVKPGQVTTGAKGKTAPFGYMTPDIVNMAAAAAVPPKKRLPYIASTSFEPGRLSLEDWRGQAAARQSMYNKQGELMGVYGPTTGQAAAQSSAAGQQAEGLAGDIAGVTSRNVDRFNQFMQGERQRKDQFNMLGADRATKLYEGNVVANQQYDNSLRQYLNSMAKTFGQGWKNRMQLGMLNAVNPMFQVSPFSGRSYFTEGYSPDKLGTSTSGNVSDYALLNKEYLKAKSQFPDLSVKDFMSLQGLSAARKTASPYNAGRQAAMMYNQAFNFNPIGFMTDDDV